MPFAIMMMVWPAGTYGQTEYYPVGTTWEEVRWPNGEGRSDSHWLMFYFHYRHTVVGDTIIDGRSYKRVEAVLIEGNKYSEDSHVGYKDYSYAIREQGDSIFYLKNGNPAYMETLVYNYDWSPGVHHDEWPDDDYPIHQMTLIDGNTYDYVDWGGNDTYQIRGIGETTWGLFVYPRVATTADLSHFLTRFTRCDVLIYEHEAPTYPLTDGVISVEANNSGTSFPSLLYDLNGRRLSGRPTKGVSIVNGKKFVERQECK